jgi:hypothetical protein
VVSAAKGPLLWDKCCTMPCWAQNILLYEV